MIGIFVADELTNRGTLREEILADLKSVGVRQNEEWQTERNQIRFEIDP